jgi:hemoglobin
MKQIWGANAVNLDMADTTPTRDLSNRTDLDSLILRFYERLLVDPEIGHFFTDVVHLDLAHHLPKIASFWESTLFQTGDYQGNPMAVHVQLDRLSPMEAKHFEVWLRHFCATVDEMFVGYYSELAKQRAHSIATIMQIKIKREALG